MRWVGEDLLTDVTAAVIDEVPGLGRAAAEFLSGRALTGDVNAVTQEFRGGRRLDLVLRDEDGLEIWVEVKDWAGGVRRPT